MNGAQYTKGAVASQPSPGAIANGNSALHKKRKKDGLKPIITTEGPEYVPFQSVLLFFFFFFSLAFYSFFFFSPFAHPLAARTRQTRPYYLPGFRQAFAFRLDAQRKRLLFRRLRPHGAAAGLDKWRGATGRVMEWGPHGGGESACCTHAHMLRHHTG